LRRFTCLCSGEARKAFYSRDGSGFISPISRSTAYAGVSARILVHYLGAVNAS
jgi:hypothetical protein